MLDRKSGIDDLRMEGPTQPLVNGNGVQLATQTKQLTIAERTLNEAEGVIGK